MEASAFGASPAPELFQMRIHQLLEGLPGVYVIADDILVAGEEPTIAVAEQDHNQKLHALLNRCKETGIKLNKDKFYRQWIIRGTCSRQMVSWQTLRKSERLDRCRVLLTSLWYSNSGNGELLYLSRFTNKLADLCKPLRDLTHNNVE